MNNKEEIHNSMSDPLNKNVAPGGLEYNANLAAPEEKSKSEKITGTDVPRGKVLSNLEYYSNCRVKKMQYHIYIPYGYNKNESNNFIYVLDGRDYLELGGINLIADYMIYSGDMPKSVLVLIDPSDKKKEYTIFEPYRNYIMNELVSHIDENYNHKPFNNKNTVLGASWGGSTAIYLALSMPEKFNKVLSQSGSLWPANWLIYDMLQECEKHDIDFCLQTGTLNDSEEMNDSIYKMLTHKGYKVDYQKYAEGHSWDNWRVHLYEGLKSLYSLGN